MTLPFMTDILENMPSNDSSPGSSLPKASNNFMSSPSRASVHRMEKEFRNVDPNGGVDLVKKAQHQAVKL